MTSQYQFGCKRHHSTTMCTMILKETIYYNTTNKGYVFCTLLDATKAFDRVNTCFSACRVTSVVQVVY